MDCEQIWVCSEHLARYVNILWTAHLHPLANYFLSRRLWTNHEHFCTPGCRISVRAMMSTGLKIVPSATWDSDSKKIVVSPAKLGVHPEQNEKKQRFHQHISHENIGIVDITDDSPAYAMSTRQGPQKHHFCKNPVDLDKVSVLRVGNQKRLQQLTRW